MKTGEAFQYLYEKNIPIVVSFPLEEYRGHFVTGKGRCYVEKVHAGVRITLGRFLPLKILNAIKASGYFYANFEINNTTYGCVLNDLVIKSPVVVASIPDAVIPFLRKYVRVEPSLKSPVNLYIKTAGIGTVSFAVKDVSERGLGFYTHSELGIKEQFICGIELPIEERTFILSEAVIVYAKEYEHKISQASSKKHRKGIFCGVELFPESEDEKMLRLYVMQRDVEIRRKLMDQW